jgi:phosphohistidine phosphatase
MKRLYLLRHAKAVPADPAIRDFSRELAPRGLEDAAAMGRYLAKHGMEPQLMLVSPAARTRQTATLLLREVAAKLDYCDALYLAEPGKILKLVQETADGIQSLMVVGHNPGLELLASLLAREPVRRKEKKRHDILEEKFPTAALAVLDFETDRWRALGPGEGKLIDFVRPKDL